MHKKYSLFIGRWQPFHLGHAYIIQQALDEGSSVCIAVRDTEISDSDPLSAQERVAMLNELYKEQDVKVIVICDIESVNIGRKVGYDVVTYDVPQNIKGISASEIRKMMDVGDISWKDKVPKQVADFLERKRKGLLKISKQKPGLVVWLTGLPGAGKTTLAYGLAKWLKSKEKRFKILDGDEIRKNLTKGLGFSKEDRDENIRRIAWVAKTLADCGVVSIVAAISPYKEAREKARILAGENFFEVHVHCSMGKLIARDPKGLYIKALKGEIKNFTGISAPYEPPESPECVVNTGQESIQQSLSTIVEKLSKLT